MRWLFDALVFDDAIFNCGEAEQVGRHRKPIKPRRRRVIYGDYAIEGTEQHIADEIARLQAEQAQAEKLAAVKASDKTAKQNANRNLDGRTLKALAASPRARGPEPALLPSEAIEIAQANERHYRMLNDMAASWAAEEEDVEMLLLAA